MSFNRYSLSLYPSTLVTQFEARTKQTVAGITMKKYLTISCNIHYARQLSMLQLLFAWTVGPGFNACRACPLLSM